MAGQALAVGHRAECVGHAAVGIAACRTMAQNLSEAATILENLDGFPVPVRVLLASELNFSMRGWINQFILPTLRDAANANNLAPTLHSALTVALREKTQIEAMLQMTAMLNPASGLQEEFAAINEALPGALEGRRLAANASCLADRANYRRPGARGGAGRRRGQSVNAALGSCVALRPQHGRGGTRTRRRVRRHGRAEVQRWPAAREHVRPLDSRGRSAATRSARAGTRQGGLQRPQEVAFKGLSSNAHGRGRPRVTSVSRPHRITLLSRQVEARKQLRARPHQRRERRDQRRPRLRHQHAAGLLDDCVRRASESGFIVRVTPPRFPRDTGAGLWRHVGHATAACSRDSGGRPQRHVARQGHTGTTVPNGRQSGRWRRNENWTPTASGARWIRPVQQLTNVEVDTCSVASRWTTTGRWALAPRRRSISCTSSATCASATACATAPAPRSQAPARPTRASARDHAVHAGTLRRRRHGEQPRTARADFYFVIARRRRQFPARAWGTEQTYGLVAQDVEAVLPDLVHTMPYGYKAVEFVLRAAAGRA